MVLPVPPHSGRSVIRMFAIVKKTAKTKNSLVIGIPDVVWHVIMHLSAHPLLSDF